MEITGVADDSPDWLTVTSVTSGIFGLVPASDIDRIETHPSNGGSLGCSKRGRIGAVVLPAGIDHCKTKQQSTNIGRRLGG